MPPKFAHITVAPLVTIDAHYDLRDGVSNGSPVRRLVESGLDPRRIVQIGIADFANSAAYACRVSPVPSLRAPAAFFVNLRVHRPRAAGHRLERHRGGAVGDLRQALRVMHRQREHGRGEVRAVRGSL